MFFNEAGKRIDKGFSPLTLTPLLNTNRTNRKGINILKDSTRKEQKMKLKIEIKKILKGDKPTKAYANIVFDNGFVVHGVGICQNEKGRFVTFPQISWKKDGVEITKSVCHPISSSAREEIEEALFEAYEQAKNN